MRPRSPASTHLFRLRDGGNAAVIMADHVDHARLLHRGQHRLGFLDVHRQRLFAKDILARLRRGNRDLGMGVVGRVNVDDIDLGIGDNVAPVGDGLAPAELFCGGLHPGLVAAADGMQYRLERDGEKFIHLAPRVRMGPAHELVADHSDIERFGHKGRGNRRTGIVPRVGRRKKTLNKSARSQTYNRIVMATATRHKRKSGWAFAPAGFFLDQPKTYIVGDALVVTPVVGF